MNNCDIVQDLLPLYKDKVVSASSMEMIEEHLQTCENCKAELAKLQGEVKVSFNPAQKAEIGALRLLKKKLLKRSVITACIFAVLAFVIIGGYIYLDSRTTIIPYRDGLITDIRVSPEHQTIGIVTKVKTGGFYTASIAVNENGEIVRLVFINFEKNAASKGRNNYEEGLIESFFNVVEPLTRPEPTPEDNPGDNDRIYAPFDRCEIYYINKHVSEVNFEADYARLRKECKLLWSGTLEHYPD
jgi:hypothetical protein